MCSLANRKLQRHTVSRDANLIKILKRRLIKTRTCDYEIALAHLGTKKDFFSVTRTVLIMQSDNRREDVHFQVYGFVGTVEDLKWMNFAYIYMKQ